ncbi:MAG: hypothetical protein ABR924_15780, partial [Terracidiphilus sp.]
MIFLDERFRAHRCNYRYSDSRCSVTHDRASRWALGWINKLDRWGKNIELGPRWLEEVLAIISLKDEVNRVKDQRGAVIEKQRRMGK